MTEAPFDFRTPTTAAKDRARRDWLQAAGRAAAKVWAVRWPFSAELKPARIEPGDPLDTIRALPDAAVGFAVVSDGAPAPALLALERPVLLGLLAGLLGEIPKTLPEDRDLTPVEGALVDFLMGQLLEPLTAAWPAQPAPRFTLSPPGLPRAVSRLPAGAPVTVVELELQAPFGSQPITLLLPEDWPAPLLDPTAAPAEAFNRADLEDALCRMPLEFTVDLGTARLTLGQLSAMKAGDVLVLDQRVGDPLHARVAGTDRFQVWPGALGSTQAVRIHTLRKAAT